MRVSTALLFEVQELVEAIEEGSTPERAGPIVVSGMLCEQLARELGAGAEPGAVVVDESGERGKSPEVRVHAMAGEPSAADEALVWAADRAGAPVVLVQLWPQERWTPPFVLTPFVVECRAGEGFPIDEIGRKIVDAAAHGTDLARRVPVLHEVVASRLVHSSVIRTSLAAALARRGSGSRSVLALDQAGLFARLRSLEGGTDMEELPKVVAAAAAAVGLSFVLRDVARSARQLLPGPLADAAVAASATWALATVARRLRFPAT